MCFRNRDGVDNWTLCFRQYKPFVACDVDRFKICVRVLPVDGTSGVRIKCPTGVGSEIHEGFESAGADILATHG